MGDIAEWHLKKVGSLSSKLGSAVQRRSRGPPAVRGQLWVVVVLVLVAQSCPTLCDPTDYSPPGSSVHGVLQARTLLCSCRLPCLSPEDLSDPGIEPRPPALQADSLSFEL